MSSFFAKFRVFFGKLSVFCNTRFFCLKLSVFLCKIFGSFEKIWFFLGNCQFFCKKSQICQNSVFFFWSFQIFCKILCFYWEVFSFIEKFCIFLFEKFSVLKSYNKFCKLRRKFLGKVLKKKIEIKGKKLVEKCFFIFFLLKTNNLNGIFFSRKLEGLFSDRMKIRLFHNLFLKDFFRVCLRFIYIGKLRFVMASDTSVLI